MLRVYGTKGGIHWRQDSPNELYFTPYGEPTRILTRGSGAFAAGGSARDAHSARTSGRLSRSLRHDLHRSRPCDPRARARARRRRAEVNFPGLDEGVAGMAFIEAAVKSSKKGGAWVKM